MLAQPPAQERSHVVRIVAPLQYAANAPLDAVPITAASTRRCRHVPLQLAHGVRGARHAKDALRPECVKLTQPLDRLVEESEVCFGLRGSLLALCAVYVLELVLHELPHSRLFPLPHQRSDVLLLSLGQLRAAQR